MLRASVLPETTTSDASDTIRRIEAWVAGYLDGPDATLPSSSLSLDNWHSHAHSLFQPRKAGSTTKNKKIEPVTGWKRVSITRNHGVTIVRLLDKTIVKESDIQEFASELIDLVDAGHERVVLDFAQVERLSCTVLPLLTQAARQCSEHNRGELRMINLRPEIANVISLCAHLKSLVIAPSAELAIATRWPGADAPRALPEALLSSLVAPRSSNDTPFELDPNEDGISMHESSEPVAVASTLSLALVIQSGNHKGRAIRLHNRKLAIGRDPSCQIRSDHAFLSRLHALVRATEDRAFLQDLGSTNGTLLNGKRMGTSERELKPGDRLEIGPLKFAVTLVARSSSKAPDEQSIAHWLGLDEEDEDTASTSDDTLYSVPSTSQPLRLQVIGNVLVITPLDPLLLGSQDVTVFRDELCSLLETATPHQVVINLKLCAKLSNAAVGLLVAHHIRLDRLGGALRLAEPHVRVAETLNQMRLPLILDVYGTEDEAVLDSWTR